MKKILLAFDGTNSSEGAFEFARRLNELSPILLTGVFLPQAELANVWSYADGVGSPLMIPLAEAGESELIQENIERFEEHCKHSGIEYRVHKDLFDLALPELKKESHYADLLILGSETFYENIDAGSPNNYLENALRDVKCPVLLVPEKFDFPENIILTYDGNEESVFAIKQFAYLFPELTNNETLLVYINNNEEEDFPDKIQIEELASRHFNNLTLYKLDIPKQHFSTWASEKKSAIVVSGSYGRHGLSQLFKHSFARDVIAEHWLPVFIAHK